MKASLNLIIKSQRLLSNFIRIPLRVSTISALIVLILCFYCGANVYAQCNDDGTDIRSSVKAISCIDYTSCESLDESSDHALMSLKAYYNSITDGFKLYAADFSVAKTTINGIRKNKSIDGVKCSLPELDYKLE